MERERQRVRQRESVCVREREYRKRQAGIYLRKSYCLHFHNKAFPPHPPFHKNIFFVFAYKAFGMFCLL